MVEISSNHATNKHKGRNQYWYYKMPYLMSDLPWGNDHSRIFFRKQVIQKPYKTTLE